MTADLGEFLRARRARISPSDVGVGKGLRPRRVPGLRREEVAELAGLSVDYYMRLEQGRSVNPSESVLDAIARALRLNDDERRHLHQLARPPRPANGVDEHADAELGEVMRWFVEGINQPAMLLTPAMDVVHANRAAVALFGQMARVDANLLRFAFTDEFARERTPNWEKVATEAVASLHMQAIRYPTDAGVLDLIADLRATSEEFVRIWERYDAHPRGRTRVEVSHPAVGMLSLTNLWLSPPASPRHTVVVYTAEPGTSSAERLAQLIDPAGTEVTSADGSTNTDIDTAP